MTWDRNQMAARAAQELEDGMYVNLGIGIPTLVANYVPDGWTSRCSRRTACWAWAPSRPRTTIDPDLINAGKQTITELSRTSYFSTADSFGMIRGGKIAWRSWARWKSREEGDLANWMIPGKLVKGMGGAMDLVAGVGRVIVVMDHTTKPASARC